MARPGSMWSGAICVSSMNEDFALQLWEQRFPSSSASSSASSAASSAAKSKEGKGKNSSKCNSNSNGINNGNRTGDTPGSRHSRHRTPVEAAADAALEAAIAASRGQPLIRRAAPPFDRLGVQVSCDLNELNRFLGKEFTR